MKVEQFMHANQFHIYNDDSDYLQSYNSLVVSIRKCYDTYNFKIITLGCNWDYSTTTSKHVYAFLEQYGDVDFYGITNKKAHIEKLMKDGVIIYDANMQ